MELADINLRDAARFGQSFPHEWFAYLREHAPVYKHPDPGGGRGFWVVSRYHDIRAVSNDWQTFSSDQKYGGVVAVLDDEERPAAPVEQTSSVELDPPAHTARRQILNRGFSPRIINAIEGRIRGYAADLIDAALARGSVDWAEDVAVPLPIRMIAELLGVPTSDEPKLLDWTNRIGSAEDPEFATDEAAYMEAINDLFAYARRLGAQRRLEPGDDVISRLLGLNGEGSGLSDDELAMSFMQLVIAGNETTRNTAISGLQALMDNPGQYAALAAEPRLVPQAVEEMLRWATPLTYFRRTATRDTEIAGVPIARGDKVVIYYASANRDERVFNNPFTFDIRRHPNPHVAFGAGGPHYCIGAHLAKLQLRVLFEELVRKAPVPPRPTGPAVRSQTLMLNGIKRLPVQFGA